MPQINKSCNMWLLYLASFSRDLSTLDSTTIVWGWSCCWFIICIFSPHSLRKVMGSNDTFWRGGGGSLQAAGEPAGCSAIASPFWGASNPSRKWGRLVLTGLGLQAKTYRRFSWWVGHFSDGRVKTEMKVKSETRAPAKPGDTIFILSALFLDFERRSMTTPKSSESFSSWVRSSLMKICALLGNGEVWF